MSLCDIFDFNFWYKTIFTSNELNVFGYKQFNIKRDLNEAVIFE